MDMSISLIMVIISQCIHVLKHYAIGIFLYVNYVSINLGDLLKYKLIGIDISPKRND